MAKLQRNAVGLAVLLSALAICATVAALGSKAVTELHEITLSVSADRSLTVRNGSKSAVSVHSAMMIEQAVGAAKWERLAVQNLLLRSRCDAPKPEMISIASGASMTALPWTGRHCASQCAESCRAEVQYPPGQYRYVVKTAQAVELTSGAFALP